MREAYSKIYGRGQFCTTALGPMYKVFSYELLLLKLLIRRPKCLPIFSYGLDYLMLDSKSLHSVSKASNTVFRWLFMLGKFGFTRLLFLNFKNYVFKVYTLISSYAFFFKVL